MAQHFISRTEAETDLLACAAYLGESIEGNDDYAEAMLAVIPRYLAKGDVDLAAELANTVDDPFTRDRLLIAVAEKCASIDDEEYALQLAEAVEDEGMQQQAREVIALVLAEKGKIEGAREIADEMAHPDQVLAGIAAAQANSGDREGAMRTVAEIGYPSASVFAHLSIASGVLDKDDDVEATAQLEAAFTPAKDIEHDEERIRAFVDIGHLFVDAKRNDKAVAALELARTNAEQLDNVHRDALLGQVSLGFLHAGSMDLADRTLDAVTDKMQIATVLLGFARDYWSKGENEDALEAIDEAYAILKGQREIETRDSKAKYSLFGSIATQFAAFEKGERAIEIAESIEEDGFRTAALSQVAQVLTANGSDELARTAISSIADDAEKVFALIAVSDIAKQKNDIDQVAGLLREAADLAGEIPQFSSRAAAYIEIAARYSDNGDQPRLRNMVSNCLDTMGDIRSENLRVASLARLSSLSSRDGFSLSDEDMEMMRALLQ
jgi:tetratricopeptide (TPR) repeat protein